MTRIDWGGTANRFYEAGIDRGVLYVGDNPGVPWIGLIAVNESQSGGEAKPRYHDGIKVSNGSTPQEFEATIEAYTYPVEFEACDGTKHVSNGLRVSQQRRKPFGMTYRVLVGNYASGLDFAYKIHIIYNALAEPSDRDHRTLSDDNEAANFNWNVTTRSEHVSGLVPSSHYVIDSRDTPAELLQTIEDILYGNSEQDASLPSPGELVFLFDSFLDVIYDAGSPYTPVYVTYDAGSPSDAYVETIDGGAL